MIVTDKYGVYHATNEGVCSFAELAEEGPSTQIRMVHIVIIPYQSINHAQNIYVIVNIVP